MNVDFLESTARFDGGIEEEYATTLLDGRPVCWVFRSGGRTYINGLGITATDITERLDT